MKKRTRIKADSPPFERLDELMNFRFNAASDVEFMLPDCSLALSTFLDNRAVEVLFCSNGTYFQSTLQTVELICIYILKSA